MPTCDDATAILPGLSSFSGNSIVASFDGGRLACDGGLLLLREIGQRLGIAARRAGCIAGPRVPEQVTHQIDEIVCFRMLMIASGYEDGNDADTLRHASMFKLAMGRLPDDGALSSQPTISRLRRRHDAMVDARRNHRSHQFFKVISPMWESNAFAVPLRCVRGARE